MAEKVLKKDTNLELGLVSFTLADGGEVLTCELEKMKGLVKQAACHGISQKVGDSIAGEADPKERRAKLSETIKNLYEGIWSVKRAKGEPSAVIIVEAIARLRSSDLAETQEKWDGLPDETKKQIRADEAVKAEVAAIKAERAKAKAEKAAAEAGEGAAPNEALAAF